MDIFWWGVAVWPWVAEAGRGVWCLDLFNHFRLQMGIALAAIAPALWSFGFEAQAAAALVSAGFCGWSVWRRGWAERRPSGGTSAPGADRAFSILTCNVWMVNRSYDRLARLIQAEDPDLIVLLETDHRWFSEMRRALTHYQHHKAEPREDYYGISVLSKHAMTAEVEYIHSKDQPSVRCRVRHPSGDFTLWCLHPEPPFLPASAERHRLALAEVGRRVREEALPAVVTGDLNTAPWARAFREGLGDLKDGAAGFGFATTWPAPLPRCLRIPIDHFLLTEHFRTLDYRILPYVGSDHRPILIRLTRSGPPAGHNQ